jgi:hypothetical protein
LDLYIFGATLLGVNWFTQVSKNAGLVDSYMVFGKIRLGKKKGKFNDARFCSARFVNVPFITSTTQ